MTKMLMVVTGADGLTLKDGTIQRTGFWAEELVVPHELFRRAAISVDATTPGGVAAPVDPKSLEPDASVGGNKVIDRFKQYLANLDDLKHPRVLEQLSEEELDSYDAIFLPGGHGPMQDLAHSNALGKIICHMQIKEKLIVAVCHGPAGLLPAIRADGSWPFKGYGMTAFTDQEETSLGLADKVPFMLETRLRQLGGDFQAGKPWLPHIIADRNLVTGQNPASSLGVAETAIDRLGAAVSR